MTPFGAYWPIEPIGRAMKTGDWLGFLEEQIAIFFLGAIIILVVYALRKWVDKIKGK